MASWNRRLSTACEWAECFQPSSMARWQSPQSSALLGGSRSVTHLGEEVQRKAHNRQDSIHTFHPRSVSESVRSETEAAPREVARAFAREQIVPQEWERGRHFFPFDAICWRISRLTLPPGCFILKCANGDSAHWRRNACGRVPLSPAFAPYPSSTSHQAGSWLAVYEIGVSSLDPRHFASGCESAGQRSPFAGTICSGRSKRRP